jgi:hypothetical protein
MENRKRNKIKSTEVIDAKTGEVLDQQMTSVRYEQEPDFVKLYYEDIGLIYRLSSMGNKTLFSLIRKMNYDNEIVLASTMKEDMSKALKMKKNTFEHGIGELVNKGILLKKGNNFYVVNPHLFGRGSWTKIREIRMVIKYTKEGRLVESVFDPQMDLPFEEQK